MHQVSNKVETKFWIGEINQGWLCEYQEHFEENSYHCWKVKIEQIMIKLKREEEKNMVLDQYSSRFDDLEVSTVDGTISQCRCIDFLKKVHRELGQKPHWIWFIELACMHAYSLFRLSWYSCWTNNQISILRLLDSNLKSSDFLPARPELKKYN